MRRQTYYHTIITYLYPTTDLGSFNYTPFSNMYKVGYTDGIKCKCAVCQFSSFISPRAVPERYDRDYEMNETHPLYIFPGGLIIAPSPIKQYLPMDITTC